jgi:hypothetical protein
VLAVDFKVMSNDGSLNLKEWHIYITHGKNFIPHSNWRLMEYGKG